ncbi:MAG: DnaJ C-terminal domain-containing protein [Neisseria sp.]|uniref:DnaJ C-terminal domain-containing protein n=1 Tax=Neisseria sp. TaxID=192066 RepID=UPI0026DD8EA9|nr:DnaJ C-terminal domain-containing protein [Neisseria sp.]MDO4641730.1 DnaJ C-terminal domain-containing protein [Neisseria sp.]
MAEKNHYEILGVAKDASLDDIKKAYRKLVRQYHPDVSKDPDADKKTSEINLAYNTLKDPEKRAEYDQMLANPFAGKAQGSGAGGFDFNPDQQGGYQYYDFDSSRFGDGQPFGSGDFRFDDIFSAFGHARTQRASRPTGPIPGEDQHAELSIDIAAAYEGSDRSLSIDMPTLTPEGEMTYEHKTLHVKIPKGIVEGQQIRLRGQGLPGFNGGGNGDLYLKIRFRESENLYVKDRKNVYQRIEVMPWTAAIGGSMEVSTPAGRLNINIPANSRNGQNLRLKGKGIPAKEAGDLYLTIQIVLPRAESETDKTAWQNLASHYGAKG